MFSQRAISCLMALTFLLGGISPNDGLNGEEPKETISENLNHTRHLHPHNPKHPTAAPHRDRFYTTRSSRITLPLPEEKEAFSFVVFGDRTGGPAEGVNVLADAVRDTNLLEPDLVMTVGDLINGYNQTEQWMDQMREFKSIMNELLCPWFPVAGNHDVYWRPLNDESMPFNQHEEHYEMNFGPLWYSFKHKNSNFIVLFSDEGNPETGEKTFSKPAAQRVSDEQFKFLKEALERGKDSDHQFIFLHHPRWLGNNYGDDWKKRVHPELLEAGNVTAVFAGHIHRMRYDPADGIDYVTLATVGGGQSETVPEAGFLHQYHVITVRPSQVAMAAFPVGEAIDVRELTGELQSQTIELARQKPRFEGKVILSEEGLQDSKFKATISNPSNRPVDFTLTPTSNDNRWQVAPDHTHGQLKPGEKKTVEFRYTHHGNSLDQSYDELSLILHQDYLAKSTRYSIPPIETEVPVRLKVSPPEESLANRALKLDGKDDAVSVLSSDFDLPQGSFTLEAWFKAKDFGNRVGFLAKTESSEYSIFMSDGRPNTAVHMNGKYRSVSPGITISKNEWHHIATVFDGKSLALYLDGEEIGRTEVDPSWRRTTNGLPFYIGADPGGNGEPMSFFHGLIDEVRLTSSALYKSSFEPERRLQSSEKTIFLYNFDYDLDSYAYDSGPNEIHSKILGGATLTAPLE